MDPASFPKKYGGQLDWKWGDMPNLDDASRQQLQGLEQPLAEGQKRKDILKGPVLFKGDHLSVLGIVDGKERRQTIPVPGAPKSESEANPAESAKIQAGDAAVSSDETQPKDEKAVENLGVQVNQLSVDERPTAA